jgi:propane 2-monooxygenase small subunit
MSQTAHQSGAAGSATFAGSDSRRYSYFEPEGKRATLYEDVTVDVQPDPTRHLIQGWIMSFADGRPSYSDKVTQIKSSDWHKFRAPDQEWSRTHYQRQSHIVNTIKMVVDNARSDGAPGRFDARWVNVLQDQLGALKHAEFGLGVALMKAQRDGMTQMINNTILTNASYKLRLAQDITLYLGDLGLDITIDGNAGKQLWLENSAWQGVRKAIEAILAATDHLEVYFAVNLVFEPLVGELFRNGFIMRGGPGNADFVTPAVVSAAASDYRQNLANTLTLMGQLVADPAHGAANRQTMAGWLAKYVPLCADAVKQLQPVWQLQHASTLDFAAVDAESKWKFKEILSELQLELPQGVAL